jgi:Ca-activated chloride channel homolog
MIPRLGALAVAVAMLGAVQQPPFRSGAYTVAVYTTVTDASGRLVPDLTRDQFEVYDNGKRQTITTFANDIQPITVVMMLDRSVSMRENFLLVRRAAEAFIERLMPGDKARIGSFAFRVQVDPREFTTDRGEMLDILRTELQEPGPTPLWNAVSVGMTALLHEQGRRVILVFTDGVDSPMPSSKNVSFGEVVKRAEREDTMVYAIGLASQYFGRYGHGGTMVGRGGFGAPMVGSHTHEPEKPDPGLARLAGASGGGYFELTRANDLLATFGRVAEELHHQYALGFEPQKLDGKTHKLEVRVRAPGATARARKSYVATRER